MVKFADPPLLVSDVKTISPLVSSANETPVPEVADTKLIRAETLTPFTVAALAYTALVVVDADAS